MKCLMYKYDPINFSNLDGWMSGTAAHGLRRGRPTPGSLSVMDATFPAMPSNT